MTFSPASIRFFRANRGAEFQGRALRKSEEYEALEQFGVPAPRWTRLTRTQVPDLSAFDRYVVLEPDRGGRGADVTITRRGRVKWKGPRTDCIRSQVGDDCNWIVQEFVYTGPHPVSYRVTCPRVPSF